MATLCATASIAVASPVAADTPPENQVKMVPALPAGAETSTYVDPRKRFTIRHDANWIAMPNWASGAELFCRWAPCQKSVMTSCTFGLTAAEGLSQTELETGQELLRGYEPAGGYDVGILGSAQFSQDTKVIEIAGTRWAISGVRLKLFDKLPMETRDWMTITDGNMFLVMCIAHPDIMPRLTTEMTRLLSGFALTKP